MALNLPLTSSNEPIRHQLESFILSTSALEFEIQINQIGKIRGTGKCVLTTTRMVLINDDGSQFKSFDLPLALIFNENFVQPIFGSNYIDGMVRPLDEEQL